jgi:hypothetical protein
MTRASPPMHRRPPVRLPTKRPTPKRRQGPHVQHRQMRRRRLDRPLPNQPIRRRRRLARPLPATDPVRNRPALPRRRRPEMPLLRHLRPDGSIWNSPKELPVRSSFPPDFSTRANRPRRARLRPPAPVQSQARAPSTLPKQSRLRPRSSGKGLCTMNCASRH